MNLAELIQSHKGDRTFAELQRDCGDYPSDKRLQQLATQPQKNFPDPPTIQALAQGLRVPEVVVVLAAAETLGIDTRRATPALLDRLPAGVDLLSEDQVRAIVDIARTFIDANQVHDIERSAWDRAVANRGGYPPGRYGPFLLEVWDQERHMVYTRAEAEEFGLPLDGETDPPPEVWIRAAATMKARALMREAGEPGRPLLEAEGEPLSPKRQSRQS